MQVTKTALKIYSAISNYNIISISRYMYNLLYWDVRELKESQFQFVQVSFGSVKMEI